MTGVLNRRGFLDALHALEPEQLSVMTLATIDVDHFKEVNDTHGHAAGDKVLQAVAQRLNEAAGDSAIVARLGGDEFVVALLAGTDTEQIRDALSSLDMDELVGSGLNVRCSVGVAAHSPHVNIDDTLAKADAELYLQKSRPIDRAVVSSV